ncbi:unnamed protein product [Rotaria sp. Silwood1]|nr:unnamed protein product [Rotaria sp. Silwood1]
MTGDEVVGIQVNDPTNPIVAGFLPAAKHVDPQWWLESSSYPIEIVDQQRVRVLIKSNELNKKYNSYAVLITFDCDSTSFRASVYKRIDDPWIGLLVLAILIFVTSIISIVILCFLWRRYQQRKQIYHENHVLSNKPTGKRQISVQLEDQQPKTYETQRMEVFVPQNNEERIHACFTPHDGTQQVHQFYERTTQAYF